MGLRVGEDLGWIPCVDGHLSRTCKINEVIKPCKLRCSFLNH